MGLLASIYRFAFLPKEVSRTSYPNVDQSKLTDQEETQKTWCAPAADLNTVRHQDSLKHFLNSAAENRAIGEELARDMGTRPLSSNNPGTDPDEVIAGTEKFYKDHGKEVTKIDWHGWGAGQTQREGSSKVPSYNWIAAQLKKDQEVLLQVGMYKKQTDGSYQRISGHFITATGFKKKNLELKINDPAPRAMRQEKTIKTTALAKTVFKSGDKELKAKGYLQLDNLDLPQGADIAVVDGAFSYTIK